jgi:hypothetical protein
MFIGPDFLVAGEEGARLHRVLYLALEAGLVTAEAPSPIDGADPLASAVPKANMKRMNPFYSPWAILELRDVV